MAAYKHSGAIVIGTSAGGLQALSTLLEKIPFDYPIPIAVVQHRAKDQRNLFEEVLQSKCRIKIKQADEKENIQSGMVYVAPPDYHLLIERNKTFSLTSDAQVRYSRPSIDVLFESAALVYQDKLIGIILTGSNNDGTAGIAAVSSHGGLTIAQDPDEAEFPFMPRASIETKKVNHIWSLARMRDFLEKIVKT